MYVPHQPVALQDQVDEHSLETYEEDSQVYDDYGQYGDDQQYGEAGTSQAVQGFEPGKGKKYKHSLPFLVLSMMLSVKF